MLTRPRPTQFLDLLYSLAKYYNGELDNERRTLHVDIRFENNIIMNMIYTSANPTFCLPYAMLSVFCALSHYRLVKNTKLTPSHA